MTLAPAARAATINYQEFFGLSFQLGQESGVLAPGDTVPAVLSYGNFTFEFTGAALTMRTLIDRDRISGLPFGFNFRASDDLAFDFTNSSFLPLCVVQGSAGPCARPGEGAWLPFTLFPTLASSPVSVAVTRVGNNTVDAASPLALLVAGLPLAAWFGRRRGHRRT